MHHLRQQQGKTKKLWHHKGVGVGVVVGGRANLLLRVRNTTYYFLF